MRQRTHLTVGVVAAGSFKDLAHVDKSLWEGRGPVMFSLNVLIELYCTNMEILSSKKNKLLSFLFGRKHKAQSCSPLM